MLLLFSCQVPLKSYALQTHITRSVPAQKIAIKPFCGEQAQDRVWKSSVLEGGKESKEVAGQVGALVC